MNRGRDLWRCEVCGAQNHVLDADCQFCDVHECSTGTEWRDDGPNTCDRCGAALGEAG